MTTKASEKLKTTINAALSAVSFLLCCWLLLVDWLAARKNPHDLLSFTQLQDWAELIHARTNSFRLQFVPVTCKQLTRGELINSNYVDWCIALAPENDVFIDRHDILAQTFAFTNIPAGAAIQATAVSKSVPGFELQGRISVPIVVDAFSASALEPGMRVALVNSNAMLPPQFTVTNQSATFQILSVNRSTGDTTSTVVISIAAEQSSLLTNIVSSQWRAVILPLQP